MQSDSRTISVTELRVSTREILDSAHFRGRHYIVERNGRPLVAILGVDEYQRLVSAIARERDADIAALIKQP